MIFLDTLASQSPEYRESDQHNAIGTGFEVSKTDTSVNPVLP